MTEPTETRPPAESPIWKYCTTLLAGICITLVGAYFANQKNVVTKDDLGVTLAAQQRQLDDQGRDIHELKATARQLEINTAQIAEHLKIEPARPQ